MIQHLLQFPLCNEDYQVFDTNLFETVIDDRISCLTFGFFQWTDALEEIAVFLNNWFDRYDKEVKR